MIQWIYFFIPAYLANAMPVIAMKLFPKWKWPVDCGAKWNGKRLLGKNKTWRGVIFGTVIGGLAFLLQKYYLSLSSLPYDSLSWWFGFLFGFGAIFVGDCGESLIKRRFGVGPGRPFMPWDQIDYTVGAFLISFWAFWPGWLPVLFLVIVNGLASITAHRIGYSLKLTKDKY